MIVARVVERDFDIVALGRPEDRTGNTGLAVVGLNAQTRGSSTGPPIESIGWTACWAVTDCSVTLPPCSSTCTTSGELVHGSVGSDASDAPSDDSSGCGPVVPLDSYSPPARSVPPPRRSQQRIRVAIAPVRVRRFDHS